MVGTVAVQRSGEHVVVHARGEFDLSTLDVFTPAMREAYDADCDVDVDLTETSFVDVTFLRLLLDTQDSVHSRGHQMKVIHPPPSLLRMIAALQVRDLEIA
jgi:anti-anti-sigma factor